MQIKVKINSDLFGMHVLYVLKSTLVLNFET